MAIGRQVTQEAAVYLSGFAGTSLLQFLALPVYTRYLGPQDYASYSLTLAITIVVMGVAAVGGDVALSRFWFRARSLSDRRDLTVSLIAFLTVWSVLVVGVGCVLAWLWGDRISESAGLSTYLILGLIGIIPAQLSRMLAQILRNEFRPLAFSATTVLTGALAVAAGLVLCVGGGLGVTGILLGTIIAETVVCIVRLPMVVSELHGRLRRSAVSAPLRFGAPFVPAAVASWVFAGADRLVVGWYLQPEDLGGYAVAAMVIAPFSILLSAVAQAWIPRVSEQYEFSAKAAARTSSLALQLAVILNGAAAVVAGAFAPLAITVLAGPGFEAGVKALPFLAVGAMFLGVSLFAGTGYTLAKRTSMVPVITGTAAALSAVLLLVLVPWAGVVGAAVSVALGYAALAGGSLTYSQRCFPVPLAWGRIAMSVAVVVLSAAVSTRSPGQPLSVVVALAALAVLAGVAAGIRRGRDSINPAADRSQKDVIDPARG